MIVYPAALAFDRGSDPVPDTGFTAPYMSGDSLCEMESCGSTCEAGSCWSNCEVQTAWA